MDSQCVAGAGRSLLVLAAFLASGLLGACTHTEPVLIWAAKPQPPVISQGKPRPATGEIRILSNRADLISGGNALVEIGIPDGLPAQSVLVEVDGRDISSSFAVRANGRYMGLVSGLKDGPNQLTARVPGTVAQSITITNHPKGGPIFSGPQLQPWLCSTQDEDLGPPTDEQCNAPTKVTYVYQPQGAKPGKYKNFDPANPPKDVATTTTDEGHVVPYIVRVERGTIDRSIYHLAVLADPAQPWEPWAPQKGWNGKLFIPFAGGCGTMYRQMSPVLFGNEQTVLRHEFISRGWMGTASGLNALGQNCNEVLSAEAVMMQKELIEETYGPIRHTIGRGGSGGSIQQNNIAASYPGLLDGITTDSTFPDSWTAFSDTIDCNLLNRYFFTVSPLMWNKSEEAAVMGKAGIASCIQWTVLLGDTADPQNRGGMRIGWSVARKGCNIPSELRYHPVKNPQGARCSAQDFQAAIWGRRGPRNAAPLPFDNEGVQYGLIPLQKKLITPEQFADLNAGIGGMDEEGDYVSRRSKMEEQDLVSFYRTSRLSDPRQLAKTPMLDVRNNENNADIHQPYMSWVMRTRLDNANGGHGNQVIWNHPGDEYKDDAVFAMDHWLMAIEADVSGAPRERKVLRNKPAELFDACWIDKRQITDSAICQKVYPYSGDARMAAGGPLSSDVRKCQLKPLDPADYLVEFTDAQWAKIRAAFPTGVCDWSKPSVASQSSEPWLSYKPGPGGKPLGPPPTSHVIQ